MARSEANDNNKYVSQVYVGMVAGVRNYGRNVFCLPSDKMQLLDIPPNDKTNRNQHEQEIYAQRLTPFCTCVRLIFFLVQLALSCAVFTVGCPLQGTVVRSRLDAPYSGSTIVPYHGRCKSKFRGDGIGITFRQSFFRRSETHDRVTPLFFAVLSFEYFSVS